MAEKESPTAGKTLFLSLFLFLCSAALTYSQQTAPPSATGTSQPPQNSPTGTVLKRTSRAVVLDVVVIDKAGHPIPGLSAQDFSLFEDGRAQAIASFEDSANSSVAGSSLVAHASPSVHISSRGTTLPSPEVATVILLIDEMNTSFKDLAYARYSMGKLLRRNNGQLPQPTALLALTNKGLVVLHDSTRDGNALWTALDRHNPEIPWRLKGGVYGASERLNISLGALERIAAAGEGARVRRNVVWISPGLPILSGIDITAESREQAFAAIRKLSDELLHARVAVYTVDPRGVPEASGLSTLSSASPSTFSAAYFQILSQSNNPAFGDLALKHFAKETGGKSFWGHNNIDAEVASSIAEGTTYYTLSYYPANSLFDGRFRKITATVNRPELTARTRDGYFAFPEPTPPTGDQLVDQIELALSNPLRYLGIPVAAKVVLLPGEPANLQILLTGDRNALSWSASPNGDQQCQLIVAAATFSSASKQKPLKIQKEDFAYVLPAAKVSTLAQFPVVYTMKLASDPAIEHIRILLRDKESGRTGTVDLRAPFSHDSTPAKP